MTAYRSLLLGCGPRAVEHADVYGDLPDMELVALCDRIPERREQFRERFGVAAVFAPSVEQMYPQGAATIVPVAGLTEGLCGARRPGHFDGVCTVVAKLLNIVAPDRAYFGAKDYQQAMVIRRMVADLDLPLQVEVCPTIREADGLAISSRNARLSASERAEAPALIESLRLAEQMVASGETVAKTITQAMRRHLDEIAPSGEIDYVEIIDPERLSSVEEIQGPVVAAVAVRFASARLIDNLPLVPPADDRV